MTGAERKRRWRAEQAHRERENEAHRARRSDPETQLQEIQRDTLRRQRQQVSRSRQRVEDLL